jgi:hypothetical protein
VVRETTAVAIECNTYHIYKTNNPITLNNNKKNKITILLMREREMVSQFKLKTKENYFLKFTVIRGNDCICIRRM